MLSVGQDGYGVILRMAALVQPVQITNGIEWK